MMHRLLLLRHAKSDWSTGLPDHERPLNKRGRKNAPDMARRLKEVSYVPDKMISSTAVRAKMTAEVFAQTLQCKVIEDNTLYDAEIDVMVDFIRNTDEGVKELMLVGHNPTWEMLAEYFTAEFITMPTCSFIQISFECSWKEVSAGKGKVVLFDYPKSKKHN